MSAPAMSEKLNVLAKRIATLEHRLGQYGQSHLNRARMQAEIKELKGLRSAVVKAVVALKSAREWHLGDRYRGSDDGSERLAWKRQLAVYDEAIANFES